MSRSRILRIAFTIALLAGVSDVIEAQSPDSPAFEVASIKPNKSGTPGFGGIGFQPNGRFSATRVSLRELVRLAYQEQPFERPQIEGGPNWIDSERFDVEAKTDTALPNDPSCSWP